MMIALHATIHDCAVTLLSDTLLNNRRIRPVWKTPVLWRDFAPLHCRLCVIADSLFEGRVEITVVEEDIWVVEPPVEMTLDRLDRLQHPIQLLVSCEHDKCGIGSWCLDVGLEAASDKGFVMLFTDFSRYRSVGLTRCSLMTVYIPDRRRCAGRHQHPSGRRVRMPHHEDQY